MRGRPTNGRHSTPFRCLRVFVLPRDCHTQYVTVAVHHTAHDRTPELRCFLNNFLRVQSPGTRFVALDNDNIVSSRIMYGRVVFDSIKLCHDDRIEFELITLYNG